MNNKVAEKMLQDLHAMVAESCQIAGCDPELPPDMWALVDRIKVMKAEVERLKASILDKKKQRREDIAKCILSGLFADARVYDGRITKMYAAPDELSGAEIVITYWPQEG